MVTSKSKQHLGCLAWLLVLVLHSRQSHLVVASSERGNEEFRVSGSLPVNDNGPPDIGGQERQARASESAVSENQGLFLLMPVDEDVKPEAVSADWGVAQGEVSREGDRARAVRRLKLALKLAPLVALLVMLGGVFLVQVEVAMSSSASKLRRLEALMPSAEKLSIAVGTSKSQQLWASVEGLLPELRQTLAEADKKSSESHFSAYASLVRDRAERRELLNKVRQNLTKVSEAVAALHKHAREELEVLAKGIRPRQPTRLQARQAQLGRALGSAFADAFVRFIDLKESRVDRILRTASMVLDRSNKMPAFTSYADEPLLLITLEDITHMRRLVSQRDYLQSRIEGITKSCARLLGSVLRAEVGAAEQEQRMLFEGVSVVFELSGQHTTDAEGKDFEQNLQAAQAVLKVELPQLSRSIKKGLSIEELLDVHAALHDMTTRLTSFLSLSGQQNVPEGGVHAKSWLREQISKAMREAERRAHDVNSQARQLVSLIEERVARARTATFCPGVLEGVAKLAQRLREGADLSLQTCREVADDFHSDKELPNVLETLRKGLAEVSNVSKKYATLQALQTHLDLLSYAEADVSLSVEMMKGVTVELLNADSSSAKLISSARTLVTRELEALKTAQDLGAAVSGGARLSEAVYSAMFAVHEGMCAQLENDHKLSRLSAWEKAQQ
ncbi:hypothetical protein Emag_005510 [Eimeria magna]